MVGADLLRTYRDVLAAPQDGEVCWWYMGTTFAQPESQPEMAVLQAETIMVYRTVTTSPTSFKMFWREIGYFRDPGTGEIARSWLNPVTGRAMAAPPSFQEGPSCYTVALNGDRLAISLVQAHALVKGIEVSVQQRDGRVTVTQTERKRRGFPLPDGTMPDPESETACSTCTVLTLFADEAAQENETCAGLYSFELDQLPGWMGFGAASGRAVVKGVMRKADLHTQVNPIAWGRLRSLFPDFFAGDRIAPNWTE